MGTHTIENVPYGNHERHRLDLYFPENVKFANGVIVYIHGGGWHSGDKSMHYKDCVYFCNLGFICASLNYRFVSSEISVLDELADINSALETIKVKCSEHGFVVKNAVICGESAGGHLSLLYAYTRTINASIKPAAVCVYCPPSDFSKSDFLSGLSSEFDDWKFDLLSKCCGAVISKEDFFTSKQQQALINISPLNYLSADCVPTAIFHGANDELVPLGHTLQLINSLNEFGVKNELIIFKNSGHSLKDDADCSVTAKECIRKYAELYL